MRTYTRTHIHVTFANPYLRCETCGKRAEGFHDESKCGCTEGNYNVPCEHPIGVNDICPSWSPVDGCTCKTPHAKG